MKCFEFISRDIRFFVHITLKNLLVVCKVALRTMVLRDYVIRGHSLITQGGRLENSLHTLTWEGRGGQTHFLRNIFQVGNM